MYSSKVVYRELAATTCELHWLTYLLRDLYETWNKVKALYIDSQSALYISFGHVFHERTIYTSTLIAM